MYSAFISLTHSSNNTLSIQLFLYDRYLHGKIWMSLTHLGFFALPIKSICSFSPSALAAAQPVILILVCFALEHFFWFQLKGFKWVNIEKKLNSSALLMFLRLQLDSNVGSEVSFQEVFISSLTWLLSLYTVLKETPFLRRKYKPRFSIFPISKNLVFVVISQEKFWK